MFRSGQLGHLVIEDEILQDDDQSGAEESHTATKRRRRRGRHGSRKGSRAALSTASTPLSVLELFGLAGGTGKSPSGPPHPSVVTWNDLNKAKAPQHDENTNIDRNSLGNDGPVLAQTSQSLSHGHSHFNGFVRMLTTPLNNFNCAVSQRSSPHPPLMPHTEHPYGNNGHRQIRSCDWAMPQPARHMTDVFTEPNSVPNFGYKAKTAIGAKEENPDALVAWVNKWGVCTHSPSSRTGLEEMLRASAPTTYED